MIGINPAKGVAHMKYTPLMVTVATLLTHAAHAAPAHWYKWTSTQTHRTVCSQAPLGQGWEKADVPYKDARCEKPANPRIIGAQRRL
jgi:hypothetical protein